MIAKKLSEVLEELKSIGIEISDQTIRNYWQKGIAPGQTSPGGGKGVQAEYPHDMAAEVAASYRLLSAPYDMGVFHVKNARELALAVVEGLYKLFFFGEAEMNLAILAQNKKTMKLVRGDALCAFLAGQWLKLLYDTQEQLYQTESRMRQENRELAEKAMAHKTVIKVYDEGFEESEFDEDGQKMLNEASAIMNELTHRFWFRTCTSSLVRLAEARPEDIKKWIKAEKDFLEEVQPDADRKQTK